MKIDVCKALGLVNMVFKAFHTIPYGHLVRKWDPSCYGKLDPKLSWWWGRVVFLTGCMYHRDVVLREVVDSEDGRIRM